MNSENNACLPAPGRIACSLCHTQQVVVFDETVTQSAQKDWRITANPLAWGNPRPQVLVLGFSKGPSQAGELRRLTQNDIPFRKGRLRVGKILSDVGLLPKGRTDKVKRAVHEAIADPNGRFGWGSLIRCTVQRFDCKEQKWVGSGGMIDQFMASPFGWKVSNACASRFLSKLPTETKLVIMFGLGERLAYVGTARKAFEAGRPGVWRTINDVAYADDTITVVHVEHFASQGANIPNWLGQNDHARARLGSLAREAVEQTLRAGT